MGDKCRRHCRLNIFSCFRNSSTAEEPLVWNAYCLRKNMFSVFSFLQFTLGQTSDWNRQKDKHQKKLLQNFFGPSIVTWRAPGGWIRSSRWEWECCHLLNNLSHQDLGLFHHLKHQTWTKHKMKLGSFPPPKTDLKAIVIQLVLWKAPSIYHADTSNCCHLVRLCGNNIYISIICHLFLLVPSRPSRHNMSSPRECKQDSQVLYLGKPLLRKSAVRMEIPLWNFAK